MRILYVANHNQVNSQDDEGAITYALQQLGHEVVCVQERHGYMGLDHNHNQDLILFHKWSSVAEVAHLPCPKIGWYFDCVDSSVSCPGDNSLLPRSIARNGWMEHILPYCDLMFCTDGDWVDNNPSGSLAKYEKLYWLPQGFDERLCRPIEPGECLSSHKDHPLLFLGISKGGGERRESWVRELKRLYGMKFYHYDRGQYRDVMRHTIRRATIVLAPDSPITDRYWSNRVYNVLGCGGFLLHPYAEGLVRQFPLDGHNTGIRYYKTREALHYLINSYLGRYKERMETAQVGMDWIMKHHTYRHRVVELLSVVKERLGVG